MLKNSYKQPLGPQKQLQYLTFLPIFLFFMCTEQSSPKKTKSKKQLRKQVRYLHMEVDMLSNETDDLRRENRQLTKGGQIVGRAMLLTATVLALKWVAFGNGR